MRSIICVLTLVSLALFCCNTPVDSGPIQVESDTLQKERIIPYYENSKVKNARGQVFLSNVSEHVGLPSIKNGTAGLYIRIWLWDGEKKYIVNLSKENGGDKFYIVEWNSIKKDSADYLVIHRELKNIQPRSGWKNLWTAVDKSRIASLQSGKPYEEQENRLTEMAYVQFEIARPGYYRYYEYLEPSYYRYVDEGSRQVNEFLKYLNSEINIPVYNPAEKLYVEPDATHPPHQ